MNNDLFVKPFVRRFSAQICAYALGVERYTVVTVRYVPRFGGHGSIRLRYNRGKKQSTVLCFFSFITTFVVITWFILQFTITPVTSHTGRLIIPRISKSTAGGRSFSYLAPKLWNNLPNTVREADTLCQFKSRLKTHLFNLAYT